MCKKIFIMLALLGLGFCNSCQKNCKFLFEPQEVDFTKVQWGEGSFEDMQCRVVKIVLANDDSVFDECEEKLFPNVTESSQVLRCILDAKETNKEFPVGGGRIWIVFEGNQGIFLDVYSGFDGKTLIKDSLGSVRESETLLVVVEGIVERIGKESLEPVPQFEVPENGFKPRNDSDFR